MRISLTKKVVLSFLICCCCLMLTSAQADEKDNAVFKVIKIDGGVLHLIDGKDPVPVKTGEEISGGKLVTLEDGTVKFTFPGGKESVLESNSMMELVKGVDSVADACAAVGAVREPTLVFLQPDGKKKLAAAKPFQMIIGINMNSEHFRNIATLSIKLVSDEDSSGKTIAQLSLPKEVKTPSDKPWYRSYKVEVVQKIKAGDYECVIETVENPVGKKVKPSLPLTFE
ncbi:MAG: hypothetical protein HQM09_00985 [Candidatus Riflebacteria bacterium]|nr:hypothetical protein [Candidatus Riflebacteria bacterium]